MKNAFGGLIGRTGHGKRNSKRALIHISKKILPKMQREKILKKKTEYPRQFPKVNRPVIEMAEGEV